MINRPTLRPPRRHPGYESRILGSLLLLLLPGLFMGCDSPPEIPDVQEPDSPGSMTTTPMPQSRIIGSLASPSPVVVPGLDASNDWFGRVLELSRDTAAGTLLALDPQTVRVVEFTTDGTLVTIYGGSRGRGPEEIYRVAGFAFNDSLLAILDVGNQKTLLYSRSGDFEGLVSAEAQYRDVAFLGSDLLLVPGQDGAVVDVASPATPDAELESLGEGEDLPVRCAGADCARLRSMCTGCQITAAGDSSFVITNIEESIIAVFDRSGRLRQRMDFLVDDPVIRGWHEEDLPLIQRENEESGGRTELLKTYFLSVQPVGDLRIGTAVAPSGPVVHESGYEYWIIDLDAGTVERYGLPRQRLGYRAVGDGPVYALDMNDGGIYKLTIPSG